MHIRSALATAASAVILLGWIPSSYAAAQPSPDVPAVAVAPTAPSPRSSGQGPDLGRLCDRLQRLPAKTPLCTHGGDPLRPRPTAPTPSASASPSAAATPADLCSDGGVSGRRIEVLYAVPKDRKNRYSELLPTMRKVLLEADQNLDDSGAATTQHYRFLCENGTDVTIRNVTLKPLGSGRFYFWDYVDSLQRQVELGLGPRNYLASNRVYMAFVDQVSNVYDYGGEANIFHDDQPDPARNANNNSAMYSMTAYFDAYIVGHEIGHNIGAVQMSAPHSSGGWHCHDDNDLMCYWDNGSYFQDGGQMTHPCTTPDVWMDCGRDDYYYPGTPPAGHYLATHWNTARSGYLTPLAPDTAAPTVVRRDPASAARAVDQRTYVSVEFSEGMRGVSGTTFTLRTAAGTAVPATVTYDATVRRATLDPTATLAADTRYTVTLTGGTSAIRDRADNPLATTSWSFTTGPRPTVTSRAPASAATAVSRAANTTATFSEPVVGVSGTTFTLKNPAGTGVPAVVTYDATTRTATLNPSSDLAADTRYTATLTGGTAGVRDRAGNPLATTTWAFTTGPRPAVSARTPASGATGISRTANVTATFSEAVRGVSTSTVTLRAGTSAAVSAVVTYDSATRRATLNPSSTLAARTTYTARLTGGTSAIRDLAGNPLTTTSWSFTTGS